MVLRVKGCLYIETVIIFVRKWIVFKNTNNSPVFGYNVEIYSYCTNSESSDEEWGSWSSDHTNIFKSAKPVKKTDLVDVNSSLDIKSGETAYIVWVEYSTGDSFGCANRGSIEVVGIFQDQDSAQQFKKYLEKSKDKAELDLTTDDGQSFHCNWAPWAGYFEYLDEVYIEETTLK